MEPRKIKEALSLVGVVGLLGGMTLAEYMHQPRNSKNVECVALHRVLAEPPPLQPTPREIAGFLHVDMNRVFYGAGGRVACNNEVSLGDISKGIAVKVAGLDEDCMATLQFPPSRKYRDRVGTDNFDVFCPAPEDDMPASDRVLA